METQRCKGTQDLLPQDMARFRHIEEIFRSCCLKWGYREIRTPTLEYLHLFTSAGTLTPDMLGKVYSFLDWDGWSGERVVLRPEGTIPAARLFVENMEGHRLAKLFYVGNIFSFEETGRESRERWQCGAELLGSAKPIADVELILLALKVLAELELAPVELSLFHAGLIRALLEEIGMAPAEQSQLFDRILDGKLDMKGIMGANPRLRDSLPLLLELKGKSWGFLKNLKASLGEALPKLEPSIDELVSIAQLLSDMGCQYQIDIASGRGFEYYTGVIFQFRLGGQKVGGGGRYNDLIPLLGGKEVPASGFALDIDQLIKLLPQKDWEDDVHRILIQNEIDTAQGWRVSFEAADLLQKAGYATEIDHGYKRKTTHRWRLKIRGEVERPAFLLADQVSRKREGANSIAEVLTILKGKP